jgi:signal transduction histidine kinase
MNRNPDRIDWSQLWYPGPTRVFSPAELALAGADRPSRTLAMMVVINAAVAAFAALQMAPDRATPRLAALMIGLVAIGLWGGARLWRQPSRRRLTIYTLVFSFASGVLALGVKWRLADEAHFQWAFGVVLGTALLVSLGWWFLTLYRAHQIEGRLRELAERERAVALAGQLMAAQIQPHFLFNSLASLQHWVQTQDPRAAPMLEALTGFLRATLPLFNRPSLTLGEELQAVRSYLQVMQARLGDRLRLKLDVPQALHTLVLPPGLLLTLVENAVEHGVMPSLAGAEVCVTGRVLAACAQVQVLDTGPGLAAEQHEGVGLANSRARLAQAWGEEAALQLANRSEGGCAATLTLPLRALQTQGP